MAEDRAWKGAGREAAQRDDPIARAILARLAELEPGRSLAPSDVARSIAASRARPEGPPGDSPDLWRRYMTAVRQQALHLAREGRIVLLRKGKPVDPHAPVKGVIRLSLPRREGRDEG